MFKLSRNHPAPSIDETIWANAFPAQYGSLSPRAQMWRVWVQTYRFWSARRRQRQDLANLAEAGDHLLRDIGVSREAAAREVSRPFWS